MATNTTSPGLDTKCISPQTCDENLPHLITHVLTTDATLTDMEQVQDIHQALEQRDLLPAIHLADAGYLDVQLLLTSQSQYQVELVGPGSQNNQW